MSDRDESVTTTQSAADRYEVREATRADLLDVFRIEQEAFPQPWPFAAFERFLEAPGFLVAEDEGVVTGYIVADVVPNHGRDLGHVKDIAVAASHQGNGIGSTLLARALAIVEASGAVSTKLEVRASNTRAIDLYRRFDFVERRRMPRYYDDGEDALVMVRDANQ